MSKSEKLDTKKLARPWLNNAANVAEQSSPETPIPIETKTSKAPRSGLSGRFIFGASISIASIITLMVVVGIAFLFGVKV